MLSRPEPPAAVDPRFGTMALALTAFIGPWSRRFERGDASTRFPDPV